MTNNLWQPSANLYHLRQRAQVIQKIRHFFAERGVLEVDTPLLCRTVNSDPYIQAFVCQASTALDNQHGYLQTSPEFAMKRLLAAGSGPIYQICKAFRQDEAARLHNPEFTLLEWYQPGFDHHQLMDEVAELIQLILPVQTLQRMTYQALFLHYVKLDPHHATLAEIQHCVDQHAIHLNSRDLPRDTWLDILMTHVIEPQIKDRVLFVYDFPVSQAALARVRPGDPPVAERFELYAYGIELANGFHELTDATEQQQRFMQDNHLRAQQNLPILPVDQHLLSALQAGLPDCAGVALGIDRLIMLALQVPRIADILSFDAQRV